MTILEHLEQAQQRPWFSIEILPPLKGQHLHTLVREMDPLMAYKPAFVNVTYHREELQYRAAGKGLMQQKIIRKRPGTLGLCAALQIRYGIDAVPHVLCGGFTKEETENLLIDLDFIGIDNVMALRGDALPGEVYFQPEPNGHRYAVELVRQIHQLNQGQYLDEDQPDNTPTRFCIGVAGYPEKHSEAPSLQADINQLKAKVDAGADFIVTQLFFDNQRYFDFVQHCREAGITVPIIPGLKPITSAQQLRTLPHRFDIALPHELVQRVQQATNATQIQQIGVQWCIEQSRALLAAGVPLIHYYSMGKSSAVTEVIREVFATALTPE